MSYTVSQTDVPPGRTRGRATNVVLWVLQAVLAIQFAFAGVLKLSGAPEMVDLFAQIGAGQWLRYTVGVLEVNGAIGLLVPLLSGLAALGVAVLMLGATITNQFVIEEGPWLPIVLLAVGAVVARGRWARTVSLAGMLGGDRGAGK